MTFFDIIGYMHIMVYGKYNGIYQQTIHIRNQSYIPTYAYNYIYIYVNIYI
jgi:hypothetical protein